MPLGAVLAGLAGCGHSVLDHGAFRWLLPRPPPAGWRTARIPTGAILAYPAGWRVLRGDRGTASAALASHNRFLGYPNITPRQAGETLTGWTAFRLAHNREEGDREITLLDSARALPFRGGRASCLRDRYVTNARTSYIELACLVHGRRADTVIVAAAPPEQWARQAPVLERAIASLVT